MKTRVLIALLTVAVFGLGYGARLWIECYRCPVPAAPALLGEISTDSSKSINAKASVGPAPNASKLAAQLESLRPQMETFRARIEQMDAELDQELLPLLRPDQLPLWDKMLKRRVEYREKEEAGIKGDNLLTSDQVASLQRQPLYKLLAVVVVPQRLEWLAGDLKLDDAQREKARVALIKRRDKFLSLVDSSPPPSLTLSRLAPLAQRLGQPQK
jgi:hypothetical protein